MTNERIIELAYVAAVKIWDELNRKYAERPNDTNAAKLEMAWNELEEVTKLYCNK